MLGAWCLLIIPKNYERHSKVKVMCIYLDEILSFPQTNFWLLADLITKVELKMVRLLVENFFFVN